MHMNSELWAGLAMATGLWMLVLVALVSPPPTSQPKELWVATSSDRVRSHPTLVRAAAPVPNKPLLAIGKFERVTSLEP